MSEKLKPCPFCGETKKIRILPVGKDENFIGCNTCHAQGPILKGSINTINHWNTRLAPDNLKDKK